MHQKVRKEKKSRE